MNYFNLETLVYIHYTIENVVGRISAMEAEYDYDNSLNIPTTIEEINAFLESRKDTTTTYCGMINPRRPGFYLFMSSLEYYYFPPGSQSNNDFVLIVVEWNDMQWAIINIPNTHKDISDDLMKYSGIRSVSDAIPMMMSSNGIDTFPFKNVNCIENIKGHAVYDGKYDFERELRLIDIIQTGKYVDPVDFKKYLYPKMN